MRRGSVRTINSCVYTREGCTTRSYAAAWACGPLTFGAAANETPRVLPVTKSCHLSNYLSWMILKAYAYGQIVLPFSLAPLRGLRLIYPKLLRFPSIFHFTYTVYTVGICIITAISPGFYF